MSIAISNLVQYNSTFPYVVLEGYSFKWTNGVYLSAVTNSEIFSSLELKYIDDFVNVRSLSAQYIPISAYQVKNYYIIDDNFMVVEIPSIGSSNIDLFRVVVKNRAGYTLTNLFSTIKPMSPEPFPTPTPSKSLPPTPTPSITQTITPTNTPTPTNTITPTKTPNLTPTPTRTVTPTFTVTPTNTVTPTTTVAEINSCNLLLSGETFNEQEYSRFLFNIVQPWGNPQTIKYDGVSIPERYRVVSLSGEILGDTGFVGDSYYNNEMIRLGYGPLSGTPVGEFNYNTKPYAIYAPATETYILSVFSPFKKSIFYANVVCPTPTPTPALVQIQNARQRPETLPQTTEYYYLNLPCDLVKYGGKFRTKISTYELADSVTITYIPYVGSPIILVDTGCVQTRPFSGTVNVPIINDFNWNAGDDGIIETKVYVNCTGSSAVPVGYDVDLFYLPFFEVTPLPITCTPVPSNTPSRTPTKTPTPTITPSSTIGSTPTQTPTNTQTPTYTPTKTPTPTPTETLQPLFVMQPDDLIALSGQQITILSSFNLSCEFLKRGGVLRTHITTFEIPDDVSITFTSITGGSPWVLDAPGCVRTKEPSGVNIPIQKDIIWPPNQDGLINVSIYTNCNGSMAPVGYSIKTFEIVNYGVTPMPVTCSVTPTPTPTRLI